MADKYFQLLHKMVQDRDPDGIDPYYGEIRKYLSENPPDPYAGLNPKERVMKFYVDRARQDGTLADVHDNYDGYWDRQEEGEWQGYHYDEENEDIDTPTLLPVKDGPRETQLWLVEQGESMQPRGKKPVKRLSQIIDSSTQIPGYVLVYFEESRPTMRTLEDYLARNHDLRQFHITDVQDPDEYRGYTNPGRIEVRIDSLSKTSDEHLPKGFIAHSEYDEYINNPDLYDTDTYQNQEEFDRAVALAEETHLDDWHKVDNTDAGHQREGDLEGMFRVLWGYKQESYDTPEDYWEYLQNILADVEKGSTAPSVIGQMADGSLYLVGGNTRAMAYAMLGKPAPVKIIPMGGTSEDRVISRYRIKRANPTDEFASTFGFVTVDKDQDYSELVSDGLAPKEGMITMVPEHAKETIAGTNAEERTWVFEIPAGTSLATFASDTDLRRALDIEADVDLDADKKILADKLTNLGYRGYIRADIPEMVYLTSQPMKPRGSFRDMRNLLYDNGTNYNETQHSHNPGYYMPQE